VRRSILAERQARLELSDSAGLAVTPTTLAKSPAKEIAVGQRVASASTTAARGILQLTDVAGHGRVFMRSSVDDATFVIGLP